MPGPRDAARWERVLERTGAAMPDDPAFRAVAAFAAGSSPYLARLMEREAALLARLAADGPLAVADAEIAASLEGAARRPAAELAKVLRTAKRRVALAIGLGDLAGLLSLAQVTGRLTAFADAALNAALTNGLAREAEAGRYLPVDAADVQTGSGLFALAMGKYGAGELNYSSDIDFVVFFDAERLRLAAGQEQQRFSVRVIQGVVKMLQERDAEGYVFRTDLRLRPDAGATQVAMSTAAAALYYEGMGQNWERAAMIKARAAAGDIEAGQAFLAELRPFVWRKSLDFAAIEDIHSIKRQIHAAHGGAEIAVRGHDLKLGRGGIREIEFFAQTQQLILGGRVPSLREPSTLGALDALATQGLIAAGVRDDLAACYGRLRGWEHRLQMIADEQTHDLPARDDEFADAAWFCRSASPAGFEASVRSTLETVSRHYGALFEKAPPLGAGAGRLVFTGVDDDPGTIETLTGLGFKRPQTASQLVRGWHHGRMAATRSPRARELLTALKPALIAAFARTPDPDAALVRFDQFLHGLPAGLQLFALLKANDALLDVIADICGSAPRLARHLARNPKNLESLLDPAFVHDMPSLADAAVSLARRMGETQSYEDRLDAARAAARDLRFRTGLKLLRGNADPRDAGFAYAAIAEASVNAVLREVQSRFEDAHGTIEDGGFAVLALGRLGAGDMTASSDLDLIFVFRHSERAGPSDGREPLTPGAYFARLSQRLIAAISAPMAQGKLYDVDMRLRPSGSKGPVAVRLEAFAAYNLTEAWTWERLALTRARDVAGDAETRRLAMAVVRAALTSGGEKEAILGDTAKMRTLMLKERKARSALDVKLARGGMIDIEFAAAALQLVHAKAKPGLLSVNTTDALGRLVAAGLMGGDDAETLAEAYELYGAINQMMRLVSDDDSREAAEAGVRRLLLRVTSDVSIESLEARLEATQRRVASVFDRVVGTA